MFVAALLYFLYSYLVRFGTVTASGPPAVSIGVDALLFSSFALHHSLLARTCAKAWISRRLPPALERSVYTWTASLLFLGTCASWRPVPGEIYRLDASLAWLGYGVQGAGLVLTFMGSAKLDVLDLAGVRPVVDARSGREPRHVPLETTGWYGVVRHPVYLAWALFVFGAPHMTATRFTFAVISTLYIALAIPLEERTLMQVFGADYRDYRRKVRWRMIPGIY
jgi:protein-S-isoprenylcysteine O-methyltransferase Ste14